MGLNSTQMPAGRASFNFDRAALPKWLTDTWSFDERFYFRRDFSDSEDYVIESKVSLTGMITQVIGIQLSFEHNHENLLALDEVSRYQKFSAGIQINF